MERVAKQSIIGFATPHWPVPMTSKFRCFLVLFFKKERRLLSLCQQHPLAGDSAAPSYPTPPRSRILSQPRFGTTPLTPRLLQPLALRPVRLLWAGLSIALIGDQMFAVVRSWVAASVFGTSAGYLNAAISIGMLAVALLSGAWADRVEHRRLMIAADLLRTTALLAVAATWAIAGTPLGSTLFVAVLLMAIGMGLYRPAMQTVLPGLVSHADELPAANALIDTTDRLSRLLGPAIVGALTAFAPLWAFLTAAGMGFAASAATTRRILREKPARLAAATSPGMLGAILTGFRVLRPHGLLWFMLMVSGWINGAWFTAFFVTLPLIIENSGIYPAGTGLAAYGTIMMAYGALNLASTLITGSRGLKALTGRTIFWGNFLLAAGIIAIGLSAYAAPPSLLFPCLLAAASIAAIGGPMHDITVATLRQIAVPGRDMPSAVRAFMLFNHLGALIAMILAPTILDHLGVANATLLCGGIIFLVATLGMIRFWRA